ncbi:MAG: hypothetical protein RLZZ433_1425, partial [Pseudomonadota bacterium]
MLREATGMAGIVVFSATERGFNGLNLCSDGKSILLSVISRWPRAPILWGAYASSAHPIPSGEGGIASDSVSHEGSDAWALFGVQKQVGLRAKHALMCAPVSLSLCEQFSFVQAHLNPSAANQKRVDGLHLPCVALMLPSPQVQTFQMPCLPEWGRQDMRAECCLEAAQLLGQPLAELAVAFELQLSPEGRLVLEVMVCQQAQVNALQSKLLALGLNLKLLTAHSRHLEQSEFWHLSSSQLARLWQVVNSFDRHHPPVRVLI